MRETQQCPCDGVRGQTPGWWRRGDCWHLPRTFGTNTRQRVMVLQKMMTRATMQNCTLGWSRVRKETAAPMMHMIDQTESPLWKHLRKMSFKSCASKNSFLSITYFHLKNHGCIVNKWLYCSLPCLDTKFMTHLWQTLLDHTSQLLWTKHTYEFTLFFLSLLLFPF